MKYDKAEVVEMVDDLKKPARKCEKSMSTRVELEMAQRVHTNKQTHFSFKS